MVIVHYYYYYLIFYSFSFILFLIIPLLFVFLDVNVADLAVISKSTLYSIKKRIKSSAQVSLELFKHHDALTTPEDCRLIADVIYAQDLNNNEMSQKEVISMIQEISCASSHAQAKNHYTYLAKRSLLLGLKNDGRVIKAQKNNEEGSGDHCRPITVACFD
jgi:hypothetical protein